mgnify:FL=1
MFKPGDLVIKNTGGNKMRITSNLSNNMVECVWFTDKYHEDIFKENDLIPFSEYNTILICEKRDDIINQILY